MFSSGCYGYLYNECGGTGRKVILEGRLRMYGNAGYFVHFQKKKIS